MERNGQCGDTRKTIPIPLTIPPPKKGDSLFPAIRTVNLASEIRIDWIEQYSAPARHNQLHSRWWGRVLPVRIRRLPHNLPSNESVVTICTYETDWRKPTVRCYRFFENELVLERYIRCQVPRRAPHGIIRRIQRDLHTAAVSQWPSYSQTSKMAHVPRMKRSQLPSCGTLPTTKIFYHVI